MEILFLIPYFVMIGFGIFFIILFIKSKSGKSDFKVLKFDNNDYFIVSFLYGDVDLKTTIGAFFDENDKYVLKCEYSDGSIKEAVFKKDEIEKFEVKIVEGISFVDKVLDYNMDYSASYFSGVPQGEMVEEKGLNISKVYETKMYLKGGKSITFQSVKNPEDYFHSSSHKK